MHRLVKKIDRIFPLHNSSSPCEDGDVGCELSERHTNRFGCAERASSTLQTERATSPRPNVCCRDETNHVLPPCFCRRFVQPWSALPVRWTDCCKQCHVADRQTDRHWQVNKETSNLFQYCGLTSYNAELLRSPQLCEVCGSKSGIQVFLDVTPCCWVNISWLFERCCYLHHEGQSDHPRKRL